MSNHTKGKIIISRLWTNMNIYDFFSLFLVLWWKCNCICTYGPHWFLPGMGFNGGRRWTWMLAGLLDLGSPVFHCHDMTGCLGCCTPYPEKSKLCSTLRPPAPPAQSCRLNSIQKQEFSVKKSNQQGDELYLHTPLGETEINSLDSMSFSNWISSRSGEGIRFNQH